MYKIRVKHRALLKLTPYIIVAWLCIVFIYIVFIHSGVRFERLPVGAIDGSWAQAALESDHPRFFSDIDCLADNSFLILRVNVLSERVEVFGRGDTAIVWEQFYVYELYILDVYKGFTDRNGNTLGRGDTIEILQFRGLARNLFGYYPPINNENKRRYFDLIRADINESDELIVFLIYNHSFLRQPSYPYGDGLEPTLFARLQHKREPGGFVRRDIIRLRIWGDWNGGSPDINSFFTLTNQVQAVFAYSLYDDVFTNVNPYSTLVVTREWLENKKDGLLW